MASASLHPDLRQLQAFAMGTLDGGSCETIEAHLAGCPACQEHVAAAAADSFVTSLRRAHDRSIMSTVALGNRPTADRPTASMDHGFPRNARPRKCFRHRRR